jgi:hypothetical protein
VTIISARSPERVDAPTVRSILGQRTATHAFESWSAVEYHR